MAFILSLMDQVTPCSDVTSQPAPPPGALGVGAQLCSGSPDQAGEDGPAGCAEREGQSWFAQADGGGHQGEGLSVIKRGQSWVNRDELSPFSLRSPSLPSLSLVLLAGGLG